MILGVKLGLLEWRWFVVVFSFILFGIWCRVLTIVVSSCAPNASKCCIHLASCIQKLFLRIAFYRKCNQKESHVYIHPLPQSKRLTCVNPPFPSSRRESQIPEPELILNQLESYYGDLSTHRAQSCKRYSTCDHYVPS